VLPQKGFLIWIPWTNIYRKGIIRVIHLDYAPLEIKEELNRTDPNLNVIDVTRMKRKKKDGKGIWVDTFQICITIRNKELPNYIYLWRARLGLESYIPAIQQCYKCGCLGHISKSRKNKEICLICSKEKHAEDTCIVPPSCINSKGGHGALDQSCPKIQESKEIKNYGT
jgi:hypothetical protein